jgi:hypothetical protein
MPPGAWTLVKGTVISSFTSIQFGLVRLLERVRPYAFRTKKLPFREALYKKVPRLDQHLLTPLRGQGHPDRSQHPSHTGEQQLKLRHFLFSRLTRNKWQ